VQGLGRTRITTSAASTGPAGVTGPEPAESAAHASSAAATPPGRAASPAACAVRTHAKWLVWVGGGEEVVEGRQRRDGIGPGKLGRQDGSTEGLTARDH
jgi:hypothetical protein